ncbi:unnamed protein product [Mucor fragilis]
MFLIFKYALFLLQTLMRSRALIERKGLLAIGFICTILFLYKIAGNPAIDKFMQPLTYYNNNNEPVCLPESYLQKQRPVKKAKAAMVILTGNIEKNVITETIVNFEEKFNKNFKYPYVFLNNEPFDETFQNAIRAVVSPETEVKFGLIPQEHWGYPEWVDKQKAEKARQEMDRNGVYFGGLESYHHMCRYYSGFFYKHPMLDEYDWYWRVEPGVKFYCDITYDPFLYMEKHNKQYGFVITLTELPSTIPSLWKHVINYAKTRHIDIKNDKKLSFLYFLDKNGDYNMCHFWSNFEIASLNLWRSPAYRDFFNYLDKTGNFFYERRGDAPIHSLAAGLFLDTDQIHYFEDFGYQHDLYRHCPSEESQLGCRCNCPIGTNDKSIDHDQNWDTCLPNWKAWTKSDKAPLQSTVWPECTCKYFYNKCSINFYNSKTNTSGNCQRDVI